MTTCEGICETDYVPTVAQCGDVYTIKLAEISKTYESVPVTPGIAGCGEVETFCLINPDKGFKGQIFRDAETGEEGVYSTKKLFGKKSYQMIGTDLKDVREGAVELLTLQPAVKIYAVAPAVEENEDTAEGIEKKVEPAETKTPEEEVQL